MSKLIFQGRHNRVWDAIFRNDSWTSIVLCRGLNPILLGRDLHSIYNIDATIEDKDVYIVLMTGDKSGDIRSHGLIFMDSLRPHTYNESTKEVMFTNSRIVLNIHDAVSDASTNFVDWRRLLSFVEDSLFSAYLYQKDNHYALRPLRIEDATSAGAKITDITIESLTLRLANKMPDGPEMLDSKSYFGTDGFRDNRIRGILEETTPQTRKNCLWWRVSMTNRPHLLPRIDEE